METFDECGVKPKRQIHISHNLCWQRWNRIKNINDIGRCNSTFDQENWSSCRSSPLLYGNDFWEDYWKIPIFSKDAIVGKMLRISRSFWKYNIKIDQRKMILSHISGEIQENMSSAKSSIEWSVNIWIKKLIRHNDEQ